MKLRVHEKMAISTQLNFPYKVNLLWEVVESQINLPEKCIYP